MSIRTVSVGEERTWVSRRERNHKTGQHRKWKGKTTNKHGDATIFHFQILGAAPNLSGICPYCTSDMVKEHGA